MPQHLAKSLNPQKKIAPKHASKEIINNDTIIYISNNALNNLELPYGALKIQCYKYTNIHNFSTVSATIGINSRIHYVKYLWTLLTNSLNAIIVWGNHYSLVCVFDNQSGILWYSDAPLVCELQMWRHRCTMWFPLNSGPQHALLWNMMNHMM